MKKIKQLSLERLRLIWDLLEKLGGKDAVRWTQGLKHFLRQENPWGVPLFFEVTTNGRSGRDWIIALKEQGFKLDLYPETFFRSNDFIATNGKIYKLALIIGDELDDDKRTNEDIRAEAAIRGYVDPPVELVPYVREMFSDKDLAEERLETLTVMHKPIRVFGSLDLFGLYHNGLLGSCGGRPEGGAFRRDGFLFLVPESSPAIAAA